jgi:molybdenum cofactor cytidylyltransferase
MKTFAIIPAAGRSRRMGRPKLLLPWGTTTVIEHVLGVWRASRVDRVIMVVHPLDTRLAELATAAGAHVIGPTPPPSAMKESVRIALAFAAESRPQPSDAWLLAPADMPGLSAATIDALIDAYEAGLRRGGQASQIWAPRCRGKRGHPVLLSWSLADEVPRLAAHEGLNALVGRHPVEYVEAAEDSVFEDFDTPEDYERLRARHGL